MTTFRLSLLFLIAFLVGADEFLLGPILTPIGTDLGVSAERITLFIVAYSLPLAVLAPVFGSLSDRHGRIAVLAPSSALFAVASIATGLAPTFEFALISRVLTGIAGAGMLPVAFAMAADQERETRAARGIAFVQSGLTLGIVLSPGMGAMIAEAASWRIAFAGLGTVAALTAILGLWAARTLPRIKSDGPRMTRDDVFVPGAAGALLAMALGLGGAVGIFSLLGERLRELFGFDTGIIGIVYVAFGLATVAGNLLMPTALRLLGSGRRVMRLAIACVLMAIIIVYAVDTSSIWPMAAAVTIWAILGGAGAPALQSHIAGLSPTRRGILMALGSSALNIGVALSSGLAGVIYAHGSVWVAVLGAVFMFAAILALRPNGPVIGDMAPQKA